MKPKIREKGYFQLFKIFQSEHLGELFCLANHDSLLLSLLKGFDVIHGRLDLRPLSPLCILNVSMTLTRCVLSDRAVAEQQYYLWSLEDDQNQVKVRHI